MTFVSNGQTIANVEYRFNALKDNLVEGPESFTWRAVETFSPTPLFPTGMITFTVNVTILDVPPLATQIAAVATAVTNLLRTTPTAGTGLTLASSLDAQLTTGTLTSDNAVGQIVKAAAATTSVATLSYEFFTGKIPSSAGYDFLVSPTGANASNLNSAYYQSFALENRYINFAVNLGKARRPSQASTAPSVSLTPPRRPTPPFSAEPRRTTRSTPCSTLPSC